MPRPGQLTRGRANRTIKTPGARNVVHRRKIYKTGGVCGMTGNKMHLPKESKPTLSRRSGRSSKRPNRPYGGVLSSRALRRGIISQTRE